MRYSIALPAASLMMVALAACGTTTQQISATNPTVTYQVDRDHPGEADEQASGYCAQFGKTASRRASTEHDGILEISYECI